MSNKNKKNNYVVENFPDTVEEEVVSQNVSVTQSGTVVNCKNLNVRKSCSKDSPIIEMIAAGSKVVISDGKSNDSFYRVTTSSGTVGYCMKPYISLDE